MYQRINWKDSPLQDTPLNAENLLRMNEGVEEVDEWVRNLEANSMPSGAIVIWYGATSSIPDGWLLCDGTLGTPDLRSMFLVGAGDQYMSGEQGGEAAVRLEPSQLPAHSHAVTSGGEHSHDVPDAGPHTHQVHYAGEHNHVQQGASMEVSESDEHRHTIRLRKQGQTQDHQNHRALAFPTTSGTNTGKGSLHITTNKMVHDCDPHLHQVDLEPNDPHEHPIQAAPGHEHQTLGPQPSSHSHGLSLAGSDPAEEHENLPPYRALYFIVKE